MAVNINPIPALSKDGEDSVWAFRNSQSGVKQLLAGSGITLSPASGLGAVTVTSSGGGGAVASVTADPAGVGLTTIPTTGVVVVKNTQPASTWSAYAATQNVALNLFKLCFQEPSSVYQYLRYNDLIDGMDLAGYQGGRLISSIEPAKVALQWSGADVTLGGNLTLNPGGSTLSPFSTGSPATRNYLDINAPAAIGATPGALRIQGNAGAINFAENIDVVAGGAQQLTFYGGSGQSLNFNTTKNVTMQGGAVTTSTTQGLVTVKMQTTNNTGLFLTAPFADPTIGKATVDGYDVAIGTGQGGQNIHNNYAHYFYGNNMSINTGMLFRRGLSGTFLDQPVIQSGTGSFVTNFVSVNIAFSPAYTTAPVIQITGIGSSATAYTYNVSNVTASGFRVNSTTAIAGTSFYWTAFGT